jgi:hypothetical protein
MEYRNVSAHAQSLVSGRLVAPGDTCEPDPDDPHDSALTESGVLVIVETATDYSALSRDQLDSLAAAAKLVVEGTGKNGAIVKTDLVKALTAHNEQREG